MHYLRFGLDVQTVAPADWSEGKIVVGRLFVRCKNSRRFHRIILTVTLLSFSVGAVYAQTVSGTILGTVTDQQNAVVGGATVTARNPEMGTIRTTRADSTGSYRISSVPAGAYEVTVAATGFKTEVHSGIMVT